MINFKNKRATSAAAEEVQEEVKSPFKKYRDTTVQIDENQFKKDRAVSFMVWTYGIIATIAIICLSVALMLLTPLKEKIPYLIRVDSSTGIVENLASTDLENAKFSQTETEALDRYFLSKYVLAHESYNYPLREINYHRVAYMSTPSVEQAYLDRMVSTNENSPINTLGRTRQIVVQIQSISFPESAGGDKVAYVRFIKYTLNESNGEKGPVSHELATINYKRVDSALSTEQRAENPLGYAVTSYSVTQEAS